MFHQKIQFTLEIQDMDEVILWPIVISRLLEYSEVREIELRELKN